MAKKTLKPIPSCTTPTSCEVPGETDEGLQLIVRDAETNCLVELTGEGVALTEDGKTVMRDGSITNPIRLPDLQALVGISVPFIAVMNKGGTVMRFPAYDGTTAKVLFTRNKSWYIGNVPSQVCYDVNDICSDCDADFITGFRYRRDPDTDAITGLCMVRIDLDKLNELSPDIWEDTNTVEVLGAGSAADPYNASVKISGDAGNILEARGDGLFVACCDSGYSYTDESEDPLDDV